MSGCQVIKSNDRWCRNYARKGLTCCWSHRNLEETVIEIAPTKTSVESEAILTGNLFMKFKQPEDGREWPTLDEVRDVMINERIDNFETLLMFEKIWMSVAESENWAIYERRMLALLVTEFHFKYLNVPINVKLFHTVVDKLRGANYDPIYIKFASEFI